jgi:hypothetical protein
VAVRGKEARFTALLHHVGLDRLRAAYWAINPKTAPGVDRVMWADYGQDLEGNLRGLHERVQAGRYRAAPSRRVYIPKADGRQRPLGIATLEDKIVQRAVVEVLNAVHETDFLGFSYGFRPGRNPHQALDFGLELHPGKTRLIEFGRRAARDRAARGLGKPETFQFLGFTHICETAKSGRFWVRRVTDAKRMRTKLKMVKDQIRQRRHLPIPEQGRWLASVVRGHQAYYAVPGNSDAVNKFRTEVARHWCKALRRRSQRTRINWVRMNRV